jgi:hypothetical protein
VPLIGKADPSSSMIGRHKNNVNVATNNEMGELQGGGVNGELEKKKTKNTKIKLHVLDARNSEHRWQCVKYATQDIVAGQCTCDKLTHDLLAPNVLQ